MPVHYFKSIDIGIKVFLLADFSFHEINLSRMTPDDVEAMYLLPFDGNDLTPRAVALLMPIPFSSKV